MEGRKKLQNNHVIPAKAGIFDTTRKNKNDMPAYAKAHKSKSITMEKCLPIRDKIVNTYKH